MSVQDKTTFFETLLESSQARKILSDTILHPFNAELSSGTLELEKFKHYLRQDSLYLVEFSRALAITASRLSLAHHFNTFVGFAQGALSAERSLHRYYFDHYNIQEDFELSPRCFAYTNYLIATASTKDPAVSVAALLPCFWVYREVGKAIYKSSVPENPFMKWIDTYAGDEFDETVCRAIEVFDSLADDANAKSRQAMVSAFVTSCRLEWMFWDAAYEKEEWVYM
jgi:thiaminase/transcriptional activator TenA